MIKQRNFPHVIIFCIISNLDLDQIIKKKLCMAHLTDTILKGFDEGLLTGMILLIFKKHLT